MPIEEAGRAVSGTIDALKQQPLVLALVVLQAVVLAAVLYNAIDRQRSVDKQFSHLFEVLDTCLKQNAPQQRGEFQLPLPRPRP